MIKSIFHYIYCMPISNTFLVMIFVCFLWQYIEKSSINHKKNAYWLYFNLALFLMWFVSVLYMTVFSREEKTGIVLQPFHFIVKIFNSGNKEFFRTAWMNFLLFVPGGLCLFHSLRIKKKKRVLIVSFILLLFTLGIETSQYLFKCGLAETDDVICNFGGAIIGALSYRWVPKLRDQLIKILKNI